MIHTFPIPTATFLSQPLLTITALYRALPYRFFTYPPPNNNVFSIYLYELSIRHSNTYTYLFFHIFQILIPTRNNSLLNFIITNIATLYSY